jgi:glycosyltransferase involved in cell wall biosynthesis
MLQPKVAVVIPTSNRAEDITLLLNKIFYEQKQIDELDLRLYVVDDSDDHLRIQRLFGREIASGRLVLLCFSQKLGGTKAYVVGMSHAIVDHTPDVLVLTDSDAIPLSNDLIWAVVACVLNRDADAVIPTNVLSREEANYSDPNVAAFHFFAVRADVVAKIGLPRHDFYIYKDDVEYRKRIELAGFEFRILTEKVYLHPTTGLNIRAVFTYGLRNSLKIAEQYGSRLDYLGELCHHLALATTYSIVSGARSILVMLIQGMRSTSTIGRIDYVSNRAVDLSQVYPSLELKDLPRNILYLCRNGYAESCLREAGHDTTYKRPRGYIRDLVGLIKGSRPKTALVSGSLGFTIISLVLTRMSFGIIPTCSRGRLLGTKLRVSATQKGLAPLRVLILCIGGLLLVSYAVLKFAGHVFRN